MNTSRSFDQAADIYDKTRLLPDATADLGIQALLEAVGQGARILEVGTGTGRISIPLMERGANLVGCDISAKMLARQHEKNPSARLIQSDAVLLPFPTGHFDTVLTVHVMHLIGPWREALREFRRVLKAGGLFLNVRTYEDVGSSIHGTIREHWRDWLKAQGVDTRHPGANNLDEIRDELRSLGARVQEVEVIRFPHRYTLSAELNRYEGRIYSNTWSVPEPIYRASLQELRSWMLQEHGDLDQEREDTSRFVFDIASFEA